MEQKVMLLIRQNDLTMAVGGVPVIHITNVNASVCADIANFLRAGASAVQVINYGLPLPENAAREAVDKITPLLDLIRVEGESFIYSHRVTEDHFCITITRSITDS